MAAVKGRPRWPGGRRAGNNTERMEDAEKTKGRREGGKDGRWRKILATQKKFSGNEGRTESVHHKNTLWSKKL